MKSKTVLTDVNVQHAIARQCSIKEIETVLEALQHPVLALAHYFPYLGLLLGYERITFRRTLRPGVPWPQIHVGRKSGVVDHKRKSVLCSDRHSRDFFDLHGLVDGRTGSVSSMGSFGRVMGSLLLVKSEIGMQRAIRLGGCGVTILDMVVLWECFFW